MARLSKKVVKEEEPKAAEPSRKDALHKLMDKYARAGASGDQWATAWREYSQL